MKIDVRSNIKQVTKGLNKVQKKEIPYATSEAINNVAFQARKALMAQSKKKLDRPTPFTVKGFQVVKSKKNFLEATVFIEPKRAKYMSFQVEGGVRLPKNRTIPVPVQKNVVMNDFGNMKRRVNTVLNLKSTFSGKPRGEGKNANLGAGIWQRTNKNKKLKMLVSYENLVSYKPRFPFYKIVTGVVEKNFKKTFEKELAHALATSR